MNIPFHIPHFSDDHVESIKPAFLSPEDRFKLPSIRDCELKLQSIISCSSVLLVGSCTQALEISLLLLDIQNGDEVICPSFTYVSVVNVILLRGGVPVFVDCKLEDCNIDEGLLEEAISPKTKAIIVMHYGGVSCNMTSICMLAKAKNIAVIEDAAHCIGAYDEDKHLGTIGDFGAISFHQTKNIHCFQGGALLINNPMYQKRAITIRDNGTNKRDYANGYVSEYTWRDIGVNYSMHLLSRLILHSQLDMLEVVTQSRISSCAYYTKKCLTNGILCRTVKSNHNGHIFYINCKDREARNRLISRLQMHTIDTRFHYVPLHQSSMAHGFRYIQRNNYAEYLGNSLLRLPLFYGMTHNQIDYVMEYVIKYYEG